MARVGLTFEALGYRDAMGRFAKRTDLLQRERREAGRRSGRRMVGAMRRHAPRKTGAFAAGLFFRTYDYGYETQVRFYAGGAHGYLLHWITDGTGPHVIPKGGSAAQLAKGYPLTFFWEKGPQGPGIYSYWSVHHPGTEANPFVEEAYAEAGPDILADYQRVAVRVARVQ